MSTSQMPTVHGDGQDPRRDDQLVLGRYRLLKRLGAGAFATVHSARDERLERDVALKHLARERVDGRRFELEARAAARLSHPAIVTLYEATVDDDGAYIVSELVRGRTLRQLLDAGRLSDRDILEIGLALAGALAHAHANGVVHRDLKPSNVLVPARRGEHVPAAKLTDFGVARVIGGESPTRAGDIIGTLDYMAPEQADGREAGPAADLFSLALVVYEALTGVNPLSGARRATGAGARRRPASYLPPVRRQRRDLPRELGAAIDRALRPRSDERGELDAFRAALLTALPSVADAPGVVVPAPAARRSRAAGMPAGGTNATVRAHGVAVAPAWPQRAAGAAGAALATGWLAQHLLTHAPLTPVGLGLASAAAVLVLPRLGAAASVLALAALATADGRGGGALVLLVLALITFVTLPGAAALWPAPAGAVALGLFGLGPAWPALVGTSPLSLPRRAGLAAAGFAWATAAGALARTSIPWRPHRLPDPASWTTSVSVALHRVVIAAASGPLVPAALVWALAAVVLPLLAVRARPAVTLVLIAVWAGVMVAATESVGAVPLRGAAAGALAGGLLAGAQPLARLARDTRHRAIVAQTVP